MPLRIAISTHYAGLLMRLQGRGETDEHYFPQPRKEIVQGGSRHEDQDKKREKPIFLGNHLASLYRRHPGGGSNISAGNAAAMEHSHGYRTGVRLLHLHSNDDTTLAERQAAATSR